MMIPTIAPTRYKKGLPNEAEAMSTFLMVTYRQLNQLTKHKKTKVMTNIEGIDIRCIEHHLDVRSTNCLTRYPTIIIAVANGTKLVHQG